MSALGHEAACACWRCEEARGVDDGLGPFRARSADPLTCPHPDDDKGPVSGDGWLCGHCGADVEGPAGVTSIERIFENAGAQGLLDDEDFL